MPSVINTNLPSLNTQRNLGTSQTALNTAIQRLSSGLRVNSAKDDAAGLAISERMNAQVKGLNVAARNANDGVSLAQTAEGALGKIGDMVQRIRELAVQSSNDTNSASDRVALQKEAAQLKDEVDRLAGTTNFNGRKLLDGSFTAANFQVGADAAQTITIAGITDAQLAGMGSVKTADTAVAVSGLSGFATAIPAGGMTLNGVDIGAVDAAGSEGERAAQLVEAINRVSVRSGVHAYLEADAAGVNQLKLTSPEAITIAGSAPAVATTGFAAGSVALADSSAMDKLDIASYGGAQLAVRQADAALKQINGARATLGAIQTRFENAVANIQIAAENTTAARSRIVDADFAAETAAMTRAQILQQAGTAMLSQANQLPQQVLSLLKG
ncbi:flagellin [Ramlibacter alkalitolerans]|uniref:Flagellin n=1 Tax=Ramlibacter alkalitolerans TaxID=2039631 RepID=A0ABS1JL01_9BURK|nr:flagellin [Ramlibacter alkalitolerans]MBL0424878.1 flagellin [Ramlibacter alkalitolerans]